jgi:Zn-dependent protease with chaperone function
MILLLVLILLFGPLMCLLALVQVKGFSARCLYVYPGLLTLVASLVFAIAPIPWYIGAGEESVLPVLELMRIYQSDPARFSEIVQDQDWDRLTVAIETGEWARAVSFSRTGAWGCLSGSLLFVTLSASFLLMAVKNALRTQPARVRLHRSPERDVSRAAISGIGFIRRFRVVFTLVWFLVGGLVLLFVFHSIAITSCIIVGVEAPITAGVWTSIVDTSIGVMAVGLGPRVPMPTVAALVQVCWIAHCMALVGTLVVSVGSLSHARRSALRRLQAEGTETTAEKDRVVRLVKALWPEDGGCCPNVAICPNSIPGAWAHSFGFVRRKNWIEVSRGLLELLNKPEDEPQLSAVLAHEMAHLVAGHGLADVVLRYVGRFTFVGDGFVRAMQDSFGHESKADEIAISTLKASPVALKRCLWRLRSVAAANVEAILLEGVGSATSSALLPPYSTLVKKGFGTLPFRVKWRMAFQHFLAYYFGTDKTAYWHPAVNDRVERIRVLEAKCRRDQKLLETPNGQQN